MEFSLPVLVSVDDRQRYEVRPVRVSPQVFQGPSLARLFDDVALAMMERVPQELPSALPRYELCPHVELRKVKIDVGKRSAQRATGQGAERSEVIERDGGWKGRVSAVVSRFPQDSFWMVNMPRLGVQTFAVDHLRHLPEAMARTIERLLDSQAIDLDQLACRPVEYLEILGFDAEPPSVLPSRPRRAKPRKKKRAEQKEEPETKKRRLVVPMMLRQVATNLTHRALDGRLDRAYLRDPLVVEIMRRVARPGAALLLVGESGAGKSAVVGEVVRRLADRSVRIEERDSVWRVDGNRIIAGMRMVGAWEARMRELVAELSARQDLLYVDDLPALVFAGRTRHGDSNVAEFLVPHLARGELRIIGECTAERLAAVRDEAPGFFSRFSIVPVPPMNEEETMRALVHAARDLAEHEDFAVAPDALETMVHLTRRFQSNQAFPGKAMALLHRTLADRRGGATDELGRSQLTREDVVTHYQRQTGLPINVLWERSSRDVAEVEAYFSSRIIAQPAAQRAAADVVALLEQGLEDPSRPLASYLFVGPTGVGKTETAKAIAECLFGSSQRMIRLDMSELSGPESVRRLFGDRVHPDGELTLAVERQPFSVVLLDEVEKAHPSVFDALLQVLGEGRLTNAAGRTIDFSSTVIVMTSNLGVRNADKMLGFEAKTDASLEAHYKSAAERFFRPEFFNRIDRIVPFGVLGRDAIVPLVRRLMEQMLSRRGLLRNQVVVDVDPQVVELVIDQGFDPRYGARSIKRMLERRLAVPLAQHLATHYVRALTLADIHPFGAEIRTALSWPESAALVNLSQAAQIKGWEELEAAFSELMQRFERLREDPRLAAIGARRAELVARMNRGDLSRDLQAELTLLAAALEQVRELGDEASAFSEAYVEVERFEERVWSEQEERPPWKGTKTTLSVEVSPIRLDRGPRLPQARDHLQNLRYSLAQLAFRVRAAVSSTEPTLLIRAAPVVATESARFFLSQVTDGLCEFFRLWGECELLEHHGDGWRAPNDRELITPDAMALLVSGPGMGEIARRELGYYVCDDGVTQLLRVEELSGEGDPIARLEAYAARERSWRERRRTEETVDPRPPLVVRRAMGRGEHRAMAEVLQIETLIRFYAELERAQ